MTTIIDTSPASSQLSRLVFCGLIFIVSALWMFHKWQQRTKFYRLGNILPGPAPVPLFGNALLAIGLNPEGIVSFCTKMNKIYGDVVRAWMGPNLFVFLTKAEDAEVILNSQVHIDKSSDYRFFKPWLGDGLLISTGDKWRSHRKMIAPTFHINILKSFMPVFNQNSKNVVEKLKSEIGKTFDVHDYLSGVTVDILLETAMGITRKTEDDAGFDYAMAVMKMCDIIHQRHYKFWLRLDSTFQLSSFFKKQTKLLEIIHGLTNKVLKQKKKIYIDNKAKGIVPPTLQELMQNDTSESVLANEVKTVSDTVFKGYKDDLDHNDENDIGVKKRLAFLDLMIESAQNGTNNLNDNEIKEEVDTIMFEGHDTTAAGSSFVLCLLGVHQEIQAKVYEELQEIFGDSNRPVTFTDTLQMKYLERVILESLRIFPPVPAIARKLNRDVQIATNNYVIPAGSTVVIIPYQIHRDTRYYKNPDVFNPDNFLPENTQNRHYYSFVPFSAGPRSCVVSKDYVLPAGATVVIGIHKIHRNPKYYNDPEVFNPDNFLPENTQNRHYYSYIPFSAGPRSCVGRKYAVLKLKVLLATILRNYKAVSEVPEKDFSLQANIILKRNDGFRMKIEPRRRVPSTAA